MGWQGEAEEFGFRVKSVSPLGRQMPSLAFPLTLHPTFPTGTVGDPTEEDPVTGGENFLPCASG